MNLKDFLINIIETEAEFRQTVMVQLDDEQNDTREWFQIESIDKDGYNRESKLIIKIIKEKK